MSDEHYYRTPAYRNPAYPVVEGEVLPDKLTITGERAGTAHREAAIAHVEKAMGLGYLTGDEAGKRVAYLKDAVTRRQVSDALKDLPLLERKKRNLDDLCAIPALYLVIALAVFGALASSGAVIMGAAEPRPGPWMYLLTVSMLAIGIIGALTSVLVMIAKTDK